MLGRRELLAEVGMLHLQLFICKAGARRYMFLEILDIVTTSNQTQPSMSRAQSVGHGDEQLVELSGHKTPPEHEVVIVDKVLKDEAQHVGRNLAVSLLTRSLLIDNIRTRVQHLSRILGNVVKLGVVLA